MPWCSGQLISLYPGTKVHVRGWRIPRGCVDADREWKSWGLRANSSQLPPYWPSSPQRCPQRPNAYSWVADPLWWSIEGGGVPRVTYQNILFYRSPQVDCPGPEVEKQAGGYPGIWVGIAAIFLWIPKRIVLIGWFNGTLILSGVKKGQPSNAILMFWWYQIYELSLLILMWQTKQVSIELPVLCTVLYHLHSVSILRIDMAVLLIHVYCTYY